jgi:hypothetical protein
MTRAGEMTPGPMATAYMVTSSPMNPKLAGGSSGCSRAGSRGRCSSGGVPTPAAPATIAYKR